MRDRTRSAVFWIAAGGLAFWLPVIVLSGVFRQNVSFVALNLTAVAGLALLGVARRVRNRPPPSWGWVLAGVYIFGPASIVVASVSTGFPSPPGHLADWLRLGVLCLFPPSTLWLATLDGMIYSVVIVSVVLGLRVAYEHR